MTRRAAGYGARRGRGVYGRTSLPAPVSSVFPLSVDASGRYLKRADGVPFLIHGDTPWSIAAQLTNAEITTYLNDRAAKGFTAIMFNAPERYFSDQTPTYRNVDGVDPFTTMTDFASALTSYWNRVDHIINSAKALGMVCIVNPAYMGINATEGWQNEVNAETATDLRTFGAALANRYTQGNVIWCLGGDTITGAAQQWNIVTGIRSVRTTDVIMAHPGPGQDGYTTWSGESGWNLNTIYTYDANDAYGDFIYNEAATEYGRAGPIPFIFMEGRYEQEPDPAVSAAQLRRQSYASLLSGACGQLFGNNPIWHFESSRALFLYSGTWQSNLASTGSTQQQYVKQLFAAFEWWKLQPKQDASVVSLSLSTGQTRLYPALASDGTFGLIWVPSSQTVTVVKSAFSPSNIRIRLYDPTAGTYSSHTASTPNTGTASVATGGERVIVVDAAP